MPKLSCGREDAHQLELWGGLKAGNLGGKRQGRGSGGERLDTEESQMGQGCGVEVESQDCREKESSWAWRRQEDTGEKEVQRAICSTYHGWSRVLPGPSDFL